MPTNDLSGDGAVIPPGSVERVPDGAVAQNGMPDLSVRFSDAAPVLDPSATTSQDGAVTNATPHGAPGEDVLPADSLEDLANSDESASQQVDLTEGHLKPFVEAQTVEGTPAATPVISETVHMVIQGRTPSKRDLRRAAREVRREQARKPRELWEPGRTKLSDGTYLAAFILGNRYVANNLGMILAILGLSGAVAGAAVGVLTTHSWIGIAIGAAGGTMVVTGLTLGPVRRWILKKAGGLGLQLPPELLGGEGKPEAKPPGAESGKEPPESQPEGP